MQDQLCEEKNVSMLFTTPGVFHLSLPFDHCSMLQATQHIFQRIRFSSLRTEHYKELGSISQA